MLIHIDFVGGGCCAISFVPAPLGGRGLSPTRVFACVLAHACTDNCPHTPHDGRYDDFYRSHDYLTTPSSFSCLNHHK